MKLIGHGAEARLYTDGEKVVKERVQKGYRLAELDEKLRKTRTRKEAKILEKLHSAGFPAPRLLEACDKSMKIEMDFLEGPKLAEVFHKQPLKFAREIGKRVGELHVKDIIHSDLTTANMILVDGKIHFIDFGLSFVSKSAEDKAVDLHLLDRALESKHYDLYEKCIKEVIEGYKEAYSEASVVLKRLEVVQKRGRHKKKN